MTGLTDRDREIAAGSILLNKIPEALRDRLLSTARAIEFDRGATVFMHGERATAIYIVAEGWVKLYRIAPNGTEAVVGVFTRGRSIGEAVALRSVGYPVSAEAASFSRLIRIDAADFLRAIREEPEMAIAIISATFMHLHALVAQLEALNARTGAQRVAEFLLELVDCEAGSCSVRLPYDKVLVAGRLGMKPESLSRAFNKLKPLGVTINQNVAEIADLEALRTYTEEDPATAWNKS